MNLTPKQKKVGIYVGIVALAVSYLIYKRNKNQKEANALLEYINTLPSQVDLSDATKQGIEAVRGTKINFNKLVLADKNGKNVSGAYSNPIIRSNIGNIVQELNTAMKGAGTDTNAFFKALFRVKSKNTLAFIDKIYLSMYKQGLFEAMKAESDLNNVKYAVFSDKTKYDLAIPFFSEGKWHPILATYFNNLPTIN